MTKNNKVECWEPKNCCGSSKCGECITLKLKLLADWVPNNPNTIQITNNKNPDPESNTYNVVVVIVYITGTPMKGTVFEATFCKSDIHNKKLYYIVNEKNPESFEVDTSKCINTIIIDNNIPIAE
jgi:hypothetical protein